MGVLKAIAQGLKEAISRWKVLLILYGANLLFALLLTYPFHKSLRDFLAHSLAAEKIAQGFDLTTFLTFSRESGSWEISAAFPLFAGLLFLIVTVFLNGGVLTSFREYGRRFSLSLFFEGCGEFFGRFFRLLLISLLFFIAVFLLCGVLKALLDSIKKGFEDERVIFALNVLWVLVTAFLVFWVNMVFDYAKILTVTHGRRRMWSATGEAIRFVFSHFGRALGIYYGLFFLAFLMTIGYFLLGQFLESLAGVWIILLLLIVRQVYILIRVGMGLAFFGSQWHFYNALAGPEPEIIFEGVHEA